jgi:hypothetical protein
MGPDSVFFSDAKSGRGHVKLMEGGRKVRLARRGPFTTSVPFDVPTGEGRLKVRLMLSGSFRQGSAVGAVRAEWTAWKDFSGLWQEDFKAIEGGWGLCSDGTKFDNGKKTDSSVGDFRGEEVTLEMDWDLRKMTVTVEGRTPVIWTDLPRDAVPGVTIGGRRGEVAILSCELDAARQVVLQLSSAVKQDGSVAVEGMSLGGNAIGPIMVNPLWPVAKLRAAFAYEMGLTAEILQLVLPCMSVLKTAYDNDLILKALRLHP